MNIPKEFGCVTIYTELVNTKVRVDKDTGSITFYFGGNYYTINRVDFDALVEWVKKENN